jgi:uncharacterized protein YjbJ (UPF0337 family)
MKQLSTLGRFLATTMLCMLAIAFTWQGAFFSNTSAMAAPASNLIATSDLGDEVQGKVSKDSGRAKGFIEDTKQKVKETAKKNAARVDEATDDGSFVEGKAKRDAARIQKRADEDAARTKSAVDTTKNAVQGAVDKIKEAFSD